MNTTQEASRNSHVTESVPLPRTTHQRGDRVTLPGGAIGIYVGTTPAGTKWYAYREEDVPPMRQLFEWLYGHTPEHYARACFHRARIKRRLRLESRERFGRERCYYCGRTLSLKAARLDHVVPLSKGGTDNADNLVLCCNACNRSKDCLLPGEWLELLSRQANAVIELLLRGKAVTA